MKEIPSKEDQIKAIAEGRLYDLLTEYLEDPLKVDVRDYLSVTKADLEKYLENSKADIERIYREFPCRSDAHDVQCIEHIQNKYEVSWMDHGKKSFTNSYPKIEEAAAVFLLRQLGMSTE